MSFFLLIDRVLNKAKSIYRKKKLKSMTGCKHSDFVIVGKITVINPNIKLGHNVVIYPDVMFYGDGEIVIGDNVNIGNGTIIYASKEGGVHIGKNTMIAAQSYITDADHGMKAGELISNQPNDVSPVFIGEDVWIAAGCKILKGANIHNGAIIGAAGLVKGEIPENAIAVGIPVKIIKSRE